MIFEENVSYQEILKVLEENPLACKTFRYYSKRTSSCLENHECRFLMKQNQIAVGYGHLDREDKLWLGMFVCDQHVGNGHSKTILQKLLSSSDDEIHLTVDKNNIKAINLYFTYGFRIYDQTDNFFYCIRR